MKQKRFTAKIVTGVAAVAIFVSVLSYIMLSSKGTGTVSGVPTASTVALTPGSAAYSVGQTGPTTSVMKTTPTPTRTTRTS